MKLTVVSDLHGNLPCIEPCDVLCICGDISPLIIQKDHIQMTNWVFNDFLNWIHNLPCDKIFFVPGNHDFWFEKFCNKNMIDLFKYGKLEILIDEARPYIFKDNNDNLRCLTFYGTPWCKPFGKWAYMISEDLCKQFYSNIPYDVDVLLTHDAPMFMNNIGTILENDSMEDAGNFQLYKAIKQKKPKYVFCGHIHSGNHSLSEYTETINEDYETGLPPEDTLTVKVANVSLLDEQYKIAYKPLTIEIMFTKYCENCDQVFEDSYEVCPNCGNTLMDTETEYEIEDPKTPKTPESVVIIEEDLVTITNEDDLNSLIDEIKEYELEDDEIESDEAEEILESNQEEEKA